MFSNTLFQSSPSPKTGRYREIANSPSYEGNVPILTQSEDWALFYYMSCQVEDLRFQSSPSPKTGRYHREVGLNLPSKEFQSSPSPKTGRYSILLIALILCLWGSNPHPVRRLGAIFNAIDNAWIVCSNPHPVRRLGAI